MPTQVLGVDITDNGDGTAAVQIGDFGYPVNISDLFSTSFDTESIRDNCRLAFLVGGYSDPSIVEYLNAVNKGIAGLEAKFGNVRILSVKLSDPSGPTYDLEFSVHSGPQAGETFGISMTLSDFQSDHQSDQTILRNLPAFFRKGQFGSLTAGAIAAAKAWGFRK